MPNTEALVDTFNYILTHPKEWNQRQWVCGTSYCYAGHAVVHIFGAVLDKDENVRLTEEGAVLMNRNEATSEFRMGYGNGYRPWLAGDNPHVSYFAAVVLGLTMEQSEALFCPINTLTDLKHHIERIAGIELPGV